MKLIFLLLGIFLITSVSATLTISPQLLDAETQINSQVDYQITITNNYDFDIFDLNFGNLTSMGFSFPNITVEKNSSKSATILFKPTTSIHENIQVPVNFKYFVDLPSGITTHEVNITDPAGFIPNYIPIKQGDSVKFNNKHTVIFDIIIEGTQYNDIPINGSITHQFNTLGAITYRDTYFNFYGVVEVLNKSTKEKAKNPNYAINWAVNINSILNPTTLKVENSKTNYEVEYGKFKKGLLTIKNNGTERAELISLTSTDWVSFNKNNINIEPGEEDWVEYTITPIVFESNDTDKSYNFTISIKATNSDEKNIDISVFVPYKTISAEYGEDVDAMNWLTNVFCPQFPTSFLCNQSAGYGENGSIIYQDSDIPINVSKRVIYDMQKDLKLTMDSNERTNNDVKMLIDMLSKEFPGLKQKLNESLLLQEENEKNSNTQRRVIWIMIFFVATAVMIVIIIKKLNKKASQKNIMEGQFEAKYET